MKNIPLKGMVSCIIPVYNRSESLMAAINSVLSQTYQNFEIIVVDDGSTDDTPKTIGSVCHKFPEKIRFLRIENGGPGKAREIGRKDSIGEFIQYLDSDDILLPEKFEVQVDALRKHPDCGIAYGITRLVDEQGRCIKEPFKLSGQKKDSLFPDLLVERWWNTHTPLYRRTICDEIGPWKELRIGEDWEYDGRAGALGVRLAFCETPVSCHRQHNDARLTGGELTVSKMQDIACLVVSLLQSAKKAGVPFDCPEMMHFSRWAFLEARRSGSFGLAQCAKDCFEAAKQTALERDPKMLVVGAMAATLGWTITGKLSSAWDRYFSRKAGLKTIARAW